MRWSDVAVNLNIRKLFADVPRMCDHGMSCGFLCELYIYLLIYPYRHPNASSSSVLYLFFLYPVMPYQYTGLDVQGILLDVSENRGTPKSSILIGFSIINHPFLGTPIFGNTNFFSTFCLSELLVSLVRLGYILGCAGNSDLRRVFD